MYTSSNTGDENINVFLQLMSLVNVMNVMRLSLC